jgi:hypothetical protein
VHAARRRPDAWRKNGWARLVLFPSVGAGSIANEFERRRIIVRHEPGPADVTTIHDVPDDLLRALKETTVFDSSELLARAGIEAREQDAVEGESLEIPIDLVEEEPARAVQCLRPPPPRRSVQWAPKRWLEPWRSRGAILILLATEVLLMAGLIYFCRWVAAAF